jgi:hypothetical protein
MTVSALNIRAHRPNFGETPIFCMQINPIQNLDPAKLDPSETARGEGQD